MPEGVYATEENGTETTLPSDIAKRTATALALAIQPDVVQGDLSAQNLEFLKNPTFKNDYEKCSRFLHAEKFDNGMPTFAEAMAIIKNFGNKKLDALRTKCKLPKLVVAPRMTTEDFDRLHQEGKISCPDTKDTLLFTGMAENETSFSVGIVEGFNEPDCLRSENNPNNYVGQHYDIACADLAQHGLRNPRSPEYIVLFKIMNEEGVTIDVDGTALLDVGERQNMKVPAVALANECEGMLVLHFAYDSFDYQSKLHQSKYLRVRPSAFGDHMPPHSAK